MPRHGHPRRDGVGFAAGAGKERDGQWLSLATGTKVLLQVRSPAVAVLARPVEGAKLPIEWTEPIEQGHLTVISSATKLARLTQGAATARNAHVAQLGQMIVVAHASSEGTLAALLKQWRMDGR